MRTATLLCKLVVVVVLINSCCSLPLAIDAAVSQVYVTQSGSGTLGGTSPTNAMSLTKFMNLGDKVPPVAGDTVFLTGEFTDQVTLPHSGTDDTHRIIYNFTNAILSSPTLPRLLLTDISFVNVIGGSFKTLDTSDYPLISFGNTIVSYVNITDWSFIGTDQGTISFLEAGWCHHLVVARNRVSKISGFVWADTIAMHDIVIEDNDISSNWNTLVQTDMIKFGDAYNVLIQGNRIVHHTPGATVERHNDIIQNYRKGGSDAGSPYGWTIRYNWLELNVTDGTGDTSFIMFESMANGPAGLSNGFAAKIYSNVMYGTVEDVGSNNGCNIGSAGTIIIHGNTFIPRGGPANIMNIATSTAAASIIASNNLGWCSSSTYVGLSWTSANSITSSHNYFYNWDGCGSTYSGTGGSCTTDPKLVSVTNRNFSLMSNSPIRKSGDSTIGTEYSWGIDPVATWPAPKLNRRDASTGWTVGAYQTETTSPASSSSSSSSSTSSSSSSSSSSPSSTSSSSSTASASPSSSTSSPSSSSPSSTASASPSSSTSSSTVASSSSLSSSSSSSPPSSSSSSTTSPGPLDELSSSTASYSSSAIQVSSSGGSNDVNIATLTHAYSSTFLCMLLIFGLLAQNSLV